ncbi:hypothetical protein BDZ45DRAFT_800537 [Acephala macrosclerotiorum]|nr:hypothetical protein BDZ45DRAFT_800537 [Acephala macrosclerotiorum]
MQYWQWQQKKMDTPGQTSYTCCRKFMKISVLCLLEKRTDDGFWNASLHIPNETDNLNESSIYYTSADHLENGITNNNAKARRDHLGVHLVIFGSERHLGGVWNKGHFFPGFIADSAVDMFDLSDLAMRDVIGLKD